MAPRVPVRGAAGFIGDIWKVGEAERFTDDVEKIAMFAGGGVGPFAGTALGAVLQPDEHRAALGVADIANLPIVALALPIRKIVTANRLGLSAETVRQIGSVLPCHHAASRSLMRSMA